MKAETIGYCKLRIGLYLFGHFYLGGWALYLGASSAETFNLFENSFSDLYTLYFASFIFLLYFFGVSALVVLKIKSKKHALMINDKGIGSDVSGIAYKFIPWREVVSADIVRSGLFVVTKESKFVVKGDTVLERRRFDALGLMTPIFFAALNKNAPYIAGLINEGVEQYNASVKGDSLDEHSSENYVQRAA